MKFTITHKGNKGIKSIYYIYCSIQSWVVNRYPCFTWMYLPDQSYVYEHAAVHVKPLSSKEVKATATATVTIKILVPNKQDKMIT